jgi:YVTN family beta-propeller protein
MARRLLLGCLAATLLLTTTASAASAPATSSPIAVSADSKLVWAVNPKANTVSVLRASNDKLLATIKVGKEPRAIAVDPQNRYAYVANAAGANVSVIRIRDARATHFRAAVVAGITTGAEPWNLVASPDGRRAYVANSAQDTISVLDTTAKPKLIGSVDVANSVCNDPDRLRHFQPRGLAITANSRHLYVTRFLSFTRAGGRQADDNGHEGAVCRLDVVGKNRRLRPAARIAIGPRVTGFTIDSNGDGVADPTSAWPNQLQSIVIRGNTAYLPNIAASPSGPLRFNVDTQAFVNTIDGVNSSRQVDSSAARFINLHLGARDPEAGKKKLFFANPWAIAFTRAKGAGAAYVVSSASDLVVKVNVAADGTLSNTVDADTTRYIDLVDGVADPGHNPQGIAINAKGTKAWVLNVLSRNISVLDLRSDRVVRVVRTAQLPARGTRPELLTVGALMFFGSRGQFDKPASGNASTSERLSSDGWQSCSSCHFEGLTDGVVWQFTTGPRKSIALNGTFNPADPFNDQRVLNYSAIFDEVDDFEINIRNVSGPGPPPQPLPCSAPPPDTSLLDPHHGLIVGDNDPGLNPCVVNAFAKPNADRSQETVTLPGGGPIPALTALREWVRSAIRTPEAPLRQDANAVAQGRQLFLDGGCATCHLGGKLTLSRKDFTSPPAAAEIATETNPAPRAGTNPNPSQYLPRFLRDIGSYNLGVPGKGNNLGNDVGADETVSANVVNGKSTVPQDALGIDFNGDGRGNGFNVPSLLGIFAVPPYYHNGACETLACVLGNPKHRTANGTLPDRLADPRAQQLVVTFLRSLGSQ